MGENPVKINQREDYYGLLLPRAPAQFWLNMLTCLSRDIGSEPCVSSHDAAVKATCPLCIGARQGIHGPLSRRVLFT